jgi:hypothetical protein
MERNEPISTTEFINALGTVGTDFGNIFPPQEG